MNIARKLIENGSYGPEALKVIGQAFDDAWAEIAGNFGEGEEEITAARTMLASAILVVATNDSRDATALKTAALQTMALNYRNAAAWSSGSMRLPR